LWVSQTQRVGDRITVSDTHPLNVRRAQVTAAERPSISSLLALAVAVVVIAGLYLGREVLVPITLALLLSFLLAPLVGLLRRIGLPKTPSVLMATVVALGVILLLGTVIGTQVADLAEDLPQYEGTIETKIGAVRSYATDHVSHLLSGLGEGLLGGAPASTGAAPASAPVDTSVHKPVLVQVDQPPPSPFQLVSLVVTPALSPLATAGIIMIVTVFMLLQQEDVRDRLIRLFGSNDLHRTTLALDDAGYRLSRYFLTQLGLNTAFGILIGIGLFFIGVPNPVLWGILATLMRFVPYIGSLISGVLPVALAAAVEPGWSMAIWTAALFLVTEPIMGQVVEPLVYGHSTGLSPLSVVVAAIFWTWLWGPVGLILSTPITLCLVVLGRHIEPLQFLDVLLGDRPALTPVEGFYQRILAGDADEAMDQAEMLLGECSLSDYYDQVALKGLQLAAGDVQRGVMTPERLATIKETILELIEDLDDVEDVAPAPRKDTGGIDTAPRAAQTTPRAILPTALPAADRPAGWQADKPVLCIAGRGALDEASAAMMAQLLTKHGLGAEIAESNQVTRGSAGNLDASSFAMVCVAYLEVNGSPSHLRYLLRRLRARFPGVPLLVGVWPTEDPIRVDQRLRAVVGADYYASSLREAVGICLDIAAGQGATQMGDKQATAA
jgi:predicted PurR-regulated permease PerM